MVQARTDAVIGGGGRKALRLEFSSRIDTTTTSSPRAMGGNNKKKQISKAPALAVFIWDYFWEGALQKVSLIQFKSPRLFWLRT
jgi:hypothetical protein